MSSVYLGGNPLPSYLRPDLAWQDVITQQSSGQQSIATHIPGAYWVRIISITWQYTTSATAGIRHPALRINTINGENIFIGEAPAGQNPSVAGIDYGWFLAAGGAWGTIDSPQTMAIPPFVLPSGWFFQCFARNGIISDTSSSAIFIVDKIPTGPPRERASVPEVLPLDLAGVGFA